MKPYTIEASKSQFKAEIALPFSKSISNRALLLKEIISRKTGFDINLKDISQADDTIILAKGIQQKSGEIDVKNAGTSLRFLTAFYAASPGYNIQINGSPRLSERPLSPLIQALRTLGADITYVQEEGKLPIQIKGKELTGGNLEVEGSQSSQFISALMMISPLLSSSLSIKIPSNTVSKNYIHLTAKVMQEMGLQLYFSENNDLLTLPQNSAIKAPATYAIERDWSSAAFFYQAVLLADQAEIFFPGLSLHSPQGDMALVDIFETIGVETKEKAGGLIIAKKYKNNLSKIKVDFQSIPDLAPAIILACAGAGLACQANGLSSLVHKESNRLLALFDTLKTLKYSVTCNEQDELIHDGLSHAFYNKKVLDTHEDHRLVMAYSMMAMHMGEIRLNEVNSVEKSFPNFWQEAAKIGISYR